MCPRSKGLDTSEGDGLINLLMLAMVVSELVALQPLTEALVRARLGIPQ